MVLFFLITSEVFSNPPYATGLPPLPTAQSRFPGDSIFQDNQFGSFGLFVNGLGAALTSNSSRFTTRYNYRNFDGYRAHSSNYSHTFDIGFETSPAANSKFRVAGHYFDGNQKRPGSLTMLEFDSLPFQADPRAVSRDEKRITQKGQVDIRYDVKFGKTLNQKIEIAGNGQIEYFEKATKEFKITTRYIMGLSARYVLNSRFWNRDNEFSAGGELFRQPERKEEYENYGGQKNDNIEQIEVEKTSIASCYLAENFELIREKVFLLLNGRYDHVKYSVAEEQVPARSDIKLYHAITPEVRLNFRMMHAVTLFAAWEMKFKNPTDKELESPNGLYLYNQDLKPQTSSTLKAGIKGNLERKGKTRFFRSLHLEAAVFTSKIDNEIVRYEIFGDEYFRNAAKADRIGFSIKGKLEIIKELFLTAAYLFSDFRYKTYPAISWEENSSLTLMTVNRDFSGNVEPNIPRNNLNLALAYAHPVGKKCSLFAKLSYLALSGVWVDDANSEKTGSYSLVNSLLGFDLTLGHFTCMLSAGVNNVFNKGYVGNVNTNSADYRFYDAGSPRDFVGSVNFGYAF